MLKGQRLAKQVGRFTARVRKWGCSDPAVRGHTVLGIRFWHKPRRPLSFLDTPYVLELFKI